MPVEEPVAAESVDELYRLIREEIRPHFSALARCRSTAELEALPLYRGIADKVRHVLDTPEQGDYTRSPAPAKESYRFLAWNIERGIHFDAQLDQLKTHAYLASCDVLLLTETDVGMARSANHAVAQEFARELGMHYAFAPCYLSLVKGSGVERHVEGENQLALHGNAVLSRYPLRDVQPIHLANGKDKMAGGEKRLGRQTAVSAEIEFPNGSVRVVSLHLDAQSTQRHRRDQMRDILDWLPGEGPAVIGGDWNTSTYNSSSAFPAIMGFWLRVLMGPDNVIRNHYLHPYNRFERELFELIEERGFDYRGANALGVRTTSYDIRDARMDGNLREWVPAWCFAFIRWSLRNHDGRCPLKIDWFATRGVEARDPIVLHEFREGREPRLSDHDPIGVDVVLS